MPKCIMPMLNTDFSSLKLVSSISDKPSYVLLLTLLVICWRVVTVTPYEGGCQAPCPRRGKTDEVHGLDTPN